MYATATDDLFIKAQVLMHLLCLFYVSFDCLLHYLLNNIYVIVEDRVDRSLLAVCQLWNLWHMTSNKHCSEYLHTALSVCDVTHGCISQIGRVM